MPHNPEIKSLRVQGNFDDALALAIQGYQQDPNDIWSLRDLAWVYYDMLKSAVNRKDLQSINNTINSICQLGIPNDETMFYENYNKLKKFSNPQYFDLIEAKEKSKADKRQEALVLYRKLFTLFPMDIEVNDGFAWEIEKELKDLVTEIEKTSKNDIVQDRLYLVRKYLMEFLNLNISKPSNLYSFALIYTFRIATHYEKFPYFVKNWGLENFRLEDFERYQKDGKSFPSLVEKVIISCCKSIEKHGYIDLVDYFLIHFSHITTRFPDNIWLKYHKGKLLLLAKRFEEAKEFILPVVREKQTESWAWGLLGNIFLEEDIEKSIACFSKGILVSNDENFITNIRLDLTKVLVKKDFYTEAKFEIESIINYKSQNNQKLPEEINIFKKREWFSSIQVASNNNELYEKYSEIANSIIFDTLPWLKAVITGKDMKSELAYITFEDKNNTSVKFKLNDIIKNLDDGAPVRVKAGNEIGKYTIYALEKREGDYWDLIPSEIGIIDDINEQKSLSHIILGINKDCIAHHSKFGFIKDYPVGSFVRCKTKSIKKDNKTKTILLTCELTVEKPNANIYFKFSGNFKDPEKQKLINSYRYNDKESEELETEMKSINCNTFGFIETNETSKSIYVHKSLVLKNKLKHDDTVICYCVHSEDKKGQSGWRAINLEVINKNRFSL